MSLLCRDKNHCQKEAGATPILDYLDCLAEVFYY